MMMIGIGTPSSQSSMAPTVASSVKLITCGMAAWRDEFQKDCRGFAWLPGPVGHAS
jgi:hypothetical protein